MTKPKPKTLWLGLVEHRHMPGTVPALLLQANEPSDGQYLKRFVDPDVRASELCVVGSFDLSAIIAAEPANLAALRDYLASVA